MTPGYRRCATLPLLKMSHRLLTALVFLLLPSMLAACDLSPIGPAATTQTRQVVATTTPAPAGVGDSTAASVVATESPATARPRTDQSESIAVATYPHPTSVPSPTETIRFTPEASSSPIETATATPMPSASPTVAATITATPSPSPTEVATATATHSPSPTEVATATPQTSPVAPTAIPTEETVPEPSEEELAEQVSQIVQAGIRLDFPSADAQPVHVFPLNLSDSMGEYWVAVTNGPQPARITSSDEVINFFHIVVAFRLASEGEWLEIDRVEIESAPQRTRPELLQTGWRPPSGKPTAWIAVTGGTGAHAGTLDLIGFDGEALTTTLSLISARPTAGELADLDGDGLLEVVANDSNPYIFCYDCATELKRETVYRWDGSRLVPVLLRAPALTLPDTVREQADRAVALAQADLWRQAAEAASLASTRAPSNDEIRWLSILINRVASARLAYAGSPGQPLLTSVFAGEYEAAVDLMRALDPAEVFALDGPLIVGTAAEQSLSTMAVQLLNYAERALAVDPERASIHAIRALGLTLASPDNLAEARSAMQLATELAPDDSFYAASRVFLDQAQEAPGTPPESPDAETPPAGPPDTFFTDGQVIGTGDRGGFVKAVHHRLARISALEFSDPGRYFDAYHEATRQAVVRFQNERGLSPSGVIDLETWSALEEASAEPPVAAMAPVTVAEPRPAHTEVGQSVAYLTFDDGPHPSFTPSILELLSRYDATATFFVLGAQVQRFPEVVAAAAQQGNEIENHTANHVSLVEVSRDEFIAEVVSTDQAIHAAVGELVDPISCLRPPYGARDERTSSIAAEMGKKIVMWDVDPQDWRRPGAEQIAQHILAHARPGAILLMHDGGGDRQQTIAALEMVLAELTARGYVFRGLPACM